MPRDLQEPAVAVLREASASMAPIIQVGDELAVAWTLSSRPRRGAVVVYFDGRRVVAHRLIATSGSRLRLKGDGNPDVDPPVEPTRYCGEIIAVTRPDGSRLDLTSLRWRVAGWAIALVARVPGSSGLRWVASRALCHLAARYLR
jgi:hypothetical protein